MSPLMPNAMVVAATPPAFVKLDDQILLAASSGIDFLAIPQGYAALKIIARMRKNSAGIQNIWMQCNGDGTANYRYQGVFGQGTSAAGLYDGSVDVANPQVGYTPGTDTAASGSLEITIPGYSSALPTEYKSWHSVFQCLGNSYIAGTFGGHWKSNTPITSLLLGISSGQFEVGSRFTLYGLAGA